jgi:hypothetical protein
MLDPSRQRRTKKFLMALTPDEHDAWIYQAEVRGFASVAAWIRYLAKKDQVEALL